jgi:hypothetical protein
LRFQQDFWRRFHGFRFSAGRGLLLYVAIALLVAAFGIGYGVYLADKGKEPDFKNDWSVTVSTAAIVFGYGLKAHWRLRRMWSFWASFIGLLTAHFAILLPIFSRMEKVRFILIGVIAPLEIVIVYALLDFIAGRLNSRSSDGDC